MEADAEILDIDTMERDIAPIDQGASRIRELISCLELCHHKAERWVRNIVEAIGAGDTKKGLGTRPADELHPAEKVWQSACGALTAWCAGSPSGSVGWSVDAVPASRLLGCLGERSPLKEWQVQRVIEKIRSAIHFPRSSDDPASQYVWILLSGGEEESMYRSRCPDRYREHADFWEQTARTIIHDSDGGDAARISLAIAIDMLWPCHWRFVENLEIVLGAIGGRLRPEKPFAACGRNIGLVPIRERMERISRALRAFCGERRSASEVADDVTALLGEPTDAKRWLARSLDKTIRLQLSPPPELRAISALPGPAWIYG